MRGKAGNIEHEDQLGSMVFATNLAGAKLLLAKIRPTVEAVRGFKPEERTSKNNEFVEKVTEQNVRQTLDDIWKDSPILAELEALGKIKTVGGIYDAHTGKVTLLK